MPSFAILFVRGRLVQLVRPKKHALSPSDIHLLTNFIMSSDSFKSTEACLTPICLPDLNNATSFHQYVSYLSDDICLVLLGSKADHFSSMITTQKAITKEFEKEDILNLVPDMYNKHYSVMDVGVPGLLHFLYKSDGIRQLTLPRYTAPYNSKTAKKRYCFSK